MERRRTHALTDAQEKPCAACGRPFGPRRRFRGRFEEVRYCSDACRRRRVPPLEARLEALLLEMALSRRPGSLCPSEVARRAYGGDDEGWRELVEPVRRAARRLAAAGRIEVLQQGRVVDAGRVRGPIRLRAGPQAER